MQTYTKNASSSLKRAVNAAFGNYTNFQVQFTTAANGVFGSGWYLRLMCVVLGWRICLRQKPMFHVYEEQSGAAPSHTLIGS